MEFPSGRAWLRPAWLAAALALVGCAHYEPQPLSPAALLDTLQSRSLEDPALRASVMQATGRAAPPWNVAALQAAATSWSGTLQAAQAAADAAGQAAVVAGRRPAVSLNAPLEYTTNPRPGESPYTAGLGLDFTLDTGGQRGYRRAQATHLAERASFEAQATLWRLRARVRDTLLDLWSSQRQAAELAGEVRAREDLARLVEHRLALGAAATPELYLARSHWQDAQTRLLAATRRAGTAAVAAAGAIGLAPSRLDPAQLDLSEFGAVPEGLPPPAVDRGLLVGRHDVQAALAGYEASQAALQLAVAGQYPEVRLGTGYTFDAGAHKIGVSIVELPLTLLQDHRPAIARAVAQRRQAGAVLQQAVADALANLEQAQAALRTARIADDAAQSRLAGEQRLASAVQRAFAQGELDRVDLLRAQAQLAAARANRELAWLDVQKAAGALLLAAHASPPPIQGDTP